MEFKVKIKVFENWDKSKEEWSVIIELVGVVFSRWYFIRVCFGYVYC